MGLIHYVGIVIAIVLVSVVFLVARENKNNVNSKPNLFSLLAVGIIIGNWFLYLLGLFLTDSYIIIPGTIGNYLFIPLWFVASIIGFLAASKEYRNNKRISVLVSGLAIINLIVGMVLWGLSKM